MKERRGRLGSYGWLAFAAALALALLVASCGGDDDSDDTDGGLGFASPTGQPPITVAPPPDGEDGNGDGDGFLPVEPTPQLGGDMFSISVDGVPGCDTTEGDAECFLDAGESFTVSFSLDKLPAEVSQYEGYDGILYYSDLTSSKTADGDPWPECEFAVSYFEIDGLAALGCALGIENPFSTYTGVLATTGFECPADAAVTTVTLAHGVGDTLLYETGSSEWSEGAGVSETLTINCGSP